MIATRFSLLLALSLCLPAAARAAPAPDTAGEPTLGDVVVTAQKESQALTKAAAAITVVPGDELKSGGLDNVRDVAPRIPSVRFQQESASTEIYIRGVGSTLDVPMVEPPTVFNLNGISLPREVAALSLFDVNQLEVLPGPQGTLYGRGSLGGTVNTTLNRPGDSPGGRAVLEAGNYDLMHLAYLQDLPALDTLQVRAGGNWYRHSGYETSGADSADDRALELAALWKPDPSLSVYLWALYEHKGGDAANLVNKGSATDPYSQAFLHADPWDDTRPAALAPLGAIEALPRNWRTALIGGELRWDLGAVQLTYLPSWTDCDWHQGYFIGSKPSDFGESIRQTTHELRLAGGDDGRAKWLAGLYYYRLETSGQLFIQVAPGVWFDASDVRDHRLEGTSAFGQVTVTVAEGLRLVAGGRASFDHRTADGFEPGVTFSLDPAAVANPRFANDDRWNHVDWKLSAEHDLGAHGLAYATVQTAFQPGTFDSFPNATTEPSNLLAIAAGLKATLLDERLRLSDELFEYHYRDLLVQAFDAGTGALRLTNAQRVLIRGDQLDVAWRVLPPLDATLAIGYLHARNERFEIAAGNFDGLQLQNAPDWTVNLGLAYRAAFGSGAQLTTALHERYEDAFWGDFLHSPGLRQAATTRSDLSITWRAAAGGYSLALWCRNLENKAVQAAAATANDPGPGNTFLEAPRTFGLTLTLSL
ncbi:MAG TPA: TonB-dependent receptor [Steroidobacteraceae bacterium]|nr:TonB-dependent receptor [Steroidobacteraceae bacterium]